MNCNMAINFEKERKRQKIEKNDIYIENDNANAKAWKAK